MEIKEKVKLVEFPELDGRLCSILIKGKDDKNEAYKGVVKDLGRWLQLKENWDDGKIEVFYIRKDQVLSIWLYKNGSG